MASFLRRIMHRYVPAHFHDPVGLATRLLKTKDPAARFAMITAALGVATTPLDLLLSRLEHRRYRRAPVRKHPLVLVCGGPRTGTTLAAQTLAQYLPVAYFSNWTSLFPRSPLIATQLSQRWLRTLPTEQKSFYGRTRGLAGMNDALFIWDRWLGQNREKVPESIDADTAASMQAFFAAWDFAFQQPLVAKCNNLNAVAHLVAEVLENCYFICLSRDPLYMAQSFYSARMLIHGGVEKPYGQVPAELAETDDPITSICEQVRYYQDLDQRQAEHIGPDRFWQVSYEQLCSDPGTFVRRVGREILGMQESQLDNLKIQPHPVANKRRIDKAIFAQLEARLANLDKLDSSHPREQRHSVATGS